MWDQAPVSWLKNPMNFELLKFSTPSCILCPEGNQIETIRSKCALPRCINWSNTSQLIKYKLITALERFVLISVALILEHIITHLFELSSAVSKRCSILYFITGCPDRVLLNIFSLSSFRFASDFSRSSSFACIIASRSFFAFSSSTRFFSYSTFKLCEVRFFLLSCGFGTSVVSAPPSYKCELHQDTKNYLYTCRTNKIQCQVMTSLSCGLVP